MIDFIVETFWLLVATLATVAGVVGAIWLLWFISTVIGKLLTRKSDPAE